MEELKRKLMQECAFTPSGKLLDELLASAEVIELKKDEILIMEGKFDPNIYILKEGVIRYTYMDGIKEMIFAFALSGSVMIAMHCYYANHPAFYQLEACCQSTVLKVSKNHYNQLIDTYHEFAKWALSLAQAQIFYLEKKDSVINGNARERLLSLISRRPEIIKKVQMKHIASYLGITQQYLSRLNSELGNSVKKDRRL